MLRTFDHTGFYETRLILLVIGLAVAGYFFYYKRDRRFLILFASGALFQTVMEYALQTQGQRGADYHVMIFGTRLPTFIAPLFQGVTEGGIFAVFAFWFADLRMARPKMKERWPFYALCAVVLGLSVVAGVAARNQAVTSVRPMSNSVSILLVSAIIFISLAIAWQKDDLSTLANFYGGLLLFSFLTYEPLHILGARYIAADVGGQAVQASFPAQILMMFLSHVFESAGGKLHYFMLPFLLGWVRLRERNDGKGRERYSTQHLQDLATRGWRKKSKFTRE